MKKFLALTLAVALCLPLAGCGLSEKDVVGVWSGEYTYNGNDFSIEFELFDDGTYIKTIEKNGSFHELEMGTYTIRHNFLSSEVVLDSRTDESTTPYTYRFGVLHNGGHDFYRE